MKTEITPQILEHYRRQALAYAERAKPSRAMAVGAAAAIPEPQPEEPAGNERIPSETVSDGERYTEFSNKFPGRGTLKVQVSTAGGSFPVAGAVVNVVLLLDGERYPIYNETTDQSGIVDGLVLPAKPASDSQNAETATGSGAEYLISVFHPAFGSRVDQTVVAFDGVETILPVELVPNSFEGGR